MAFGRGTTYRLVRAEQPDLRRHLWIVVSDPREHASGQVVAASLTSARSGEPPCVVLPGEHPFVAHESFLSAQYARLIEPRNLELALAATKIALGAEASAPLVDRLRVGLLAHEETPNTVRAFLRAIGVRLPLR